MRVLASCVVKEETEERDRERRDKLGLSCAKLSSS
jgi:hypothetical protein